MRLRGALDGTEHARTRSEPEIAQLIGEGGSARELEFALRDERAAVAALAPDEQALPFELAKRLAQRHPADAEALRKHALRGQPVTGREPAALDRVLERNLDLGVGRPAPGLDRSFRQRHYGLDFSMIEFA